MNHSASHRPLRWDSLTPEFIELYDLTDRETEILHLIVLQYSNAEIATRISVTRNTVKFHLKNLLSKLCVSCRQEAARKALLQIASQQGDK